MAHSRARHPHTGSSASRQLGEQQAGHGAHAHAGHAHAMSANADRRLLAAALGLLVVFMACELAAAIVSQSLALLSDAAHMLTDAAALGMSLLALTLAQRPPSGSLTFGLRRMEILSALANGVVLLLLAALIAFEAVRRLISPPHVHGALMLAVALAGILVNTIAVWLLSRANRRSLNVEGSFQHLLTDLYAFIGTAVAAVVILVSGFERADAIASLVIAALMARSGVALARDSGRVFLEAAPHGLDPQEIGRALASQQGVVEVHDLHVWEVTSGFPALSAHVLVGAESDCHAVRRGLEALLQERFGLHHTTLQVDHTGEQLLSISPAAPRSAPLS